MSFARKSKEHFTVVSVNDPAIDRHSPEGKKALAKYIKERDVSVLKFYEGQKHARFICRPLPNDAVIEVEAENDPKRRCSWAFALTLERIEDLGFDPSEPIAKVPVEAFGGWEMLTDRCRKSLADELGQLIVREVGGVALQRALLSEHQKKAYSLPPGCEVDSEIDIPANVSITPTTGSRS